MKTIRGAASRRGNLPVSFLGIFLALGLAPSLADAQVPAGYRTNLYSHVLRAVELDATFGRIRDSLDVSVKPNYAVSFRVSTEKRPWQLHTDADEVWLVRSSSARVALAPFTLQLGVLPPGEVYEVAAGDILYIPRHLAYQIDPGTDRFEYVAIRTFDEIPPDGDPSPVLIRAADSAFSDGSRTEDFGTAGRTSISWVRHQGRAASCEAHEAVDHLYFVRNGEARASLDGRLINPRLAEPGRVEGSGVEGASQYTIKAGDIVWVPRNTARCIDPGAGTVDYLSVRIISADSLVPQAVSGTSGAF